MKQIRILCYGDSNTWGYISGSDHQRYGNNERWTKILSNYLGNNYEIIEEGLNSRTLISNDTRPGKEGKNGYEYLIPCLDTHDPIDLVVLMLGTNELKSEYNKSAKDVGEMLEKYFVKTILNRKSQLKDSYPNLLIVVPPLVNEELNTIHFETNKYEGATQKSKELNDIYKDIAKRYNCYFLSNQGLETGIDGVHLTKESHKKLAEMLEDKINNIYKTTQWRSYMIDIEKAKIAFKDFLNEYEDKSDLGFELKIVHTYHVAENSKQIAEKLNLSKEDIELAELIGILHDIGRFEELKITKELNSVKFDHAGHGSKMLFEKGMIRKFIEDSQYDSIIKKAIENHSRLEIEKNLDERTFYILK